MHIYITCVVPRTTPSNRPCDQSGYFIPVKLVIMIYKIATLCVVWGNINSHYDTLCGDLWVLAYTRHSRLRCSGLYWIGRCFIKFFPYLRSRRLKFVAYFSWIRLLIIRCVTRTKKLKSLWSSSCAMFSLSELVSDKWSANENYYKTFNLIIYVTRLILQLNGMLLKNNHITVSISIRYVVDSCGHSTCIINDILCGANHKDERSHSVWEKFPQSNLLQNQRARRLMDVFASWCIVSLLSDAGWYFARRIPVLKIRPPKILPSLAMSIPTLPDPVDICSEVSGVLEMWQTFSFSR